MLLSVFRYVGLFLLVFFQSLTVPAFSQSPFCGPQVLSRVYEIFQVEKGSFEKLDNLARHQHGLTSFDDLAKDAHHQKLQTFAFKNGTVDDLQLASQYGPMIINNRGHFALIEKVDDQGVHIFNPGFKAERYSFSFEVFKKHWDGNALVISNRSLKRLTQCWSTSWRA